MFNANCDWSILIDVLVWGFGNLTLVRSKKGPWFLLLGTLSWCPILQYIPRNMHTVFALLCFVVVIHWLIFPYPSGLLHWHCGNLTIAPVPAKQPWWIWINISCGFIMNDCITTTKQSTTKPCAYLLGIYCMSSHCNSCDYEMKISYGGTYGSAEGSPRVVEKRKLLSHPYDLRKEAYPIRMTK